MECSICCSRMIGGDTDEAAVVTSTCGHLFHMLCVKQYITSVTRQNETKPQNQRLEAQCPLCKQGKMSEAFKLHLQIDSGLNEQLLMSRVSDISIAMEKSDKNNGEMLQQLIIAAAGITKSMKSFEYQNDTLRKENAELKGGVEGGSKNDLAAIKAKDNIIANLQKEVSDLKNNRAEAAREMNVLTDQVNLLKSAAKGEKCSPPIKKSIPHSFSIKFDDFSDNLIIE